MMMLMRLDNGLNLAGIDSQVLRPITTAFSLPSVQHYRKYQLTTYPMTLTMVLNYSSGINLHGKNLSTNESINHLIN